ncbi:MAG: aldo/keto reductase [Oxalobacter sp.]|jgi:diketogulonate reductase-like aldo/keto reductase|nr:aldo/keto reductase [Oxalobacter sp.]
MQTYTLNNGVKIPVIGFGTWETPNDTSGVDAILYAITQAGYTHIDTAAAYRNEESVGKAIRESGISRDKFFVTSKLWNTKRGYDNTMRAFDRTLQNLQMDYLDLYLIHWPAIETQFPDTWKQINLDTWRAMEKLYKDGRIRAIGVSNFMPHHLQPLLDACEVVPAVNQIEVHPGYQQVEAVKFCKEKGIQVEAWSPLGRGDALTDQTIMDIAARLGRTPAQVCLRWVLDKGLLPLVKSVTPSRILQNIDVFNFSLSPEDTAVIDALTDCGGMCLHPDKVKF